MSPQLGASEDSALLILKLDHYSSSVPCPSPCPAAFFNPSPCPVKNCLRLLIPTPAPPGIQPGVHLRIFLLTFLHIYGFMLTITP